MIIGKAIYDILSNDAPVSGVVGTKIYPLRISQNVSSPAISYTTYSNNATDTKSGVSELDQVMFQVSSFDKSYEVAADLNEKVRTALDRKSGTYGTLEIQSIQYLNTVTEFDDESFEHMIISEFKLRLKR